MTEEPADILTGYREWGEELGVEIRRTRTGSRSRCAALEDDVADTFTITDSRTGRLVRQVRGLDAVGHALEARALGFDDGGTRAL